MDTAVHPKSRASSNRLLVVSGRLESTDISRLCIVNGNMANRVEMNSELA